MNGFVGRGVTRCSAARAQFLKYGGAVTSSSGSSGGMVSKLTTQRLISSFQSTTKSAAPSSAEGAEEYLDRMTEEKSMGYHGLNSGATKKRGEWTDTKEELNSQRLDIDGHPVMQRWETPYMRDLAAVATSKGGRVLEVGFGMGISANAIQKCDIEEHVILEANADVFQRLQKFASSSAKPVTPIGPGLWQDTIEQVVDGSVTGILYDTYPLAKEEQHTHQFDFIGRAFDKLRPGGVLTYCNLTSLGVLRSEFGSWDELFAETQLPHLLACGFREEDVSFSVVSAAPSDDCKYYQHETALVPVCIKHSSDPVWTGLGQKGLIKLKGDNFVPLAPRISARAEAKLAALEQELVTLTKEVSKMRSLDEAKQKRIAGSVAANRRVNAWTQWGQLREVVVGVADHACFIPPQPAEQPAVNKEGGSGATDHKGSGAGQIIADELKWPMGQKKQETIDAANAQLDGLATTLEKRGIRVMRPDATIDWSQPLKTPFFEVPHQYCSTCGRDSLITLGNIMLEAAMSRRDRHFEVLAYRDIIGEMRSIDPDCMWKAAPRPTLRDSMFNNDWWDLKLDERYDRMHSFEFCVTEDEPVFDAADITRCGKDIFVQVSKSCNNAGIHWLRQELNPHGFRVHKVRFPYDLAPSHLDCTFVPLRPGLVLTNPERPILDEDAEIFRRNGWRFVDAPQPKNPERPWASQSSKWLSMNVLVVGPNEVVCEAEETPLHQVLSDEGFEVIPVPFRDVYEFGGGLHCATWDLTRDDAMEDFFPIQ